MWCDRPGFNTNGGPIRERRHWLQNLETILEKLNLSLVGHTNRRIAQLSLGLERNHWYPQNRQDLRILMVYNNFEFGQELWP